MFLWFGPQHEHFYGFYIVDGSERRKDPANSLISYLKVALQVIFYDFTCSFQEYCFNGNQATSPILNFIMISFTASHIHVLLPTTVNFYQLSVE